MNNRRGMMTSLMTIGAAGAAAYGIQRGMRNGTFRKMTNNLSNAMNMGNNQNQNQQNPMAQQAQQAIKQMQNADNSQEMQDQMGYRRNSQ